jgi:hypothetical protein
VGGPKALLPARSSTASPWRPAAQELPTAAASALVEAATLVKPPPRPQALRPPPTRGEEAAAVAADVEDVAIHAGALQLVDGLLCGARRVAVEGAEADVAQSPGRLGACGACGAARRGAARRGASRAGRDYGGAAASAAEGGGGCMQAPGWHGRDDGMAAAAPPTASARPAPGTPAALGRRPRRRRPRAKAHAPLGSAASGTPLQIWWLTGTISSFFRATATSRGARPLLRTRRSAWGGGGVERRRGVWRRRERGGRQCKCRTGSAAAGVACQVGLRQASTRARCFAPHPWVQARRAMTPPARRPRRPHLRALLALQQLRGLVQREPLRGHAPHCLDGVARPDARLVGGPARRGRHHGELAAAALGGHQRHLGAHAGDGAWGGRGDAARYSLWARGGRQCTPPQPSQGATRTLRRARRHDWNARARRARVPTLPSTPGVPGARRPASAAAPTLGAAPQRREALWLQEAREGVVQRRHQPADGVVGLLPIGHGHLF